MPDAKGNFTPTEITDALLPYMTGDTFTPSSATTSAIESFKSDTQPIVEQEAELAGLGRSGALLDTLADAYATELTPFYTADLENRLTAADLAGTYQLGTRKLNQTGATALADIGATEADRETGTYGDIGTLALGLEDPYSSASTLGQNRQTNSLVTFGEAGSAQSGTAQDTLDAQYADYLRRQALSENATTGLFGGSVLPSSITSDTTSKTKTSGGK